jgi:trehalose 6-phosphate phosphatase
MPPFAGNWALFLDVDGTLLDHADSPDAVSVEPALRALLARLLAATRGALALVSGRPVADLARLFAPLEIPAAGQHGTERRAADGSVHRHAPPRARLREAASRLARLAAPHAGLLLEDKGMTLALHYRRAPALAGRVEREMRAVAAALGDAFELQAGKFVWELKPSGRDKGVAIAEFLREAPFRGRLPVFLGDDLTDEQGFALVNRLGGHSVKVGPGPTGARWRLADAAAVRGWLAQYADYER